MTETSPDVYISVGSNINPEANLKAALGLLRQYCTVLAVSPVYQSPAFGFENQPDFLDIVVKVTTPLPPEQFKQQVLDDIEQKLGRNRALQQSKYGPLPVDMDILLWGDKAFSYGAKPWQVPDKSITKYAAVAIPLADVAPDVIHRVEGVTIQQIAARFDPSEIHKRADLTLEHP